MTSTKRVQPEDATVPAETKPPAPESARVEPDRRTKAPAVVLVDYVGAFAAPQATQAPPDLEPAMERRRARASERFGKRLRPHEIAPLVANPRGDGKGDAKITLRSGLNLVDAKAWTVNAPATEQPQTAIGKRVAAGQIVVLEALPRGASAIIELCERTVCPDALAALRKHEHGRRGGENGEHARDEVLEAIDHRLATVTRRAAGPSSGPRLGAAQVERRHRRSRAS